MNVAQNVCWMLVTPGTEAYLIPRRPITWTLTRLMSVVAMIRLASITSKAGICRTRHVFCMQSVIDRWTVNDGRMTSRTRWMKSRPLFELILSCFSLLHRKRLTDSVNAWTVPIRLDPRLLAFVWRIVRKAEASSFSILRTAVVDVIKSCTSVPYELSTLPSRSCE